MSGTSARSLCPAPKRNTTQQARTQAESTRRRTIPNASTTNAANANPIKQRPPQDCYRNSPHATENRGKRASRPRACCNQSDHMRARIQAITAVRQARATTNTHTYKNTHTCTRAHTHKHAAMLQLAKPGAAVKGTAATAHCCCATVSPTQGGREGYRRCSPLPLPCRGQLKTGLPRRLLPRLLTATTPCPRCCSAVGPT